jgi:tetratricopeptide (TPR) repeat protein
MTTVTTGTGLLPPDTAQRSIDVQAQVRRNAEEHGDALRELLEWEESMKIRDANNLKKPQKKKVRAASGSGGTGVKEAVGAGQKEERITEEKQQQKKLVDNQQSGTDDKISGVVSNPSPSALILPGSASENISDNDIDKSLKDIANDERQKGNACYARGNFDDAVKCYTTCLLYDPQSAVAYSNRGEYYSY